MLRRSWGILAVFTVLGMTGAISTVILATPRFDATASVFIASKATESPLDSLASSLYAQTRLVSYAEVANSPAVLSPVATELGLTSTLDELAGRVTAKPVADSLLIAITASSRFSTEAAALANAVAAQLIDVIELKLESEMTNSGSGLNGAVVEPAIVPLNAAYPRLSVALPIGAGAGFLQGLGIMLIRYSFDSRLRSIRQLAEFTPTPIIGLIGWDRSRELSTIVTLKPDSRVAKNFTTFRTALQYVNFEASGNSILVTAVHGNEGTTTVAVNLAIALASLGKRVAIVDANIRRPGVKKSVRMTESTGLLEVLAGDSSLTAELDYWSEVPELNVLGTGDPRKFSIDLLATKRVGTLIRDLEDRFDEVIIDCAALADSADGATLSRLVGSTLLVVRAESARRADVAMGVGVLGRSGTLRGIVLNGVHKRFADLDDELIGDVHMESPRRGNT